MREKIGVLCGWCYIVEWVFWVKLVWIHFLYKSNNAFFVIKSPITSLINNPSSQHNMYLLYTSSLPFLYAYSIRCSIISSFEEKGRKKKMYVRCVFMFLFLYSFWATKHTFILSGVILYLISFLGEMRVHWGPWKVDR